MSPNTWGQGTSEGEDRKECMCRGVCVQGTHSRIQPDVPLRPGQAGTAQHLQSPRLRAYHARGETVAPTQEPHDCAVVQCPHLLFPCVVEGLNDAPLGKHIRKCLPCKQNHAVAGPHLRVHLQPAEGYGICRLLTRYGKSHLKHFPAQTWGPKTPLGPPACPGWSQNPISPQGCQTEGT